MRTNTKKSREQSRRMPMYSEKGARRSYSMHSKTHYDKIKEMLRGKK